jgi:hypothetical protein
MCLIALWFRQTKEEREKLEELHLKRELLEALQRLPISFGTHMRTYAHMRLSTHDYTTNINIIGNEVAVVIVNLIAPLHDAIRCCCQ